MALKLRRKGVKRPPRPKGIAFRTSLEGQSAVLMCERVKDGISITIGSMMAGAAMKIGVRLDKSGEKQLLEWLTMKVPVAKDDIEQDRTRYVGMGLGKKRTK